MKIKNVALVGFFFLNICSAMADENWVYFKIDVQSSHPHKGNITESIPFQFTGASKVKLHFAYLDLKEALDPVTNEKTYCGSVELRDEQHNPVTSFQTLQGIHPDPFWTDVIYQDQFNLKFDTCENSAGANGYVIDQVAVAF